MPTSTTEARTPSLAMRRLERAWIVGGLALLALLIGVRWLRYTPWTAHPSLDRVFAELMVLDVQAFVWPWVYTTLKLDILALAAAVLVVGLHRRLPGLLVTRRAGRLALAPPATLLLVGAMAWLHYLFDLNVTTAKVCATTLLLLWATRRVRRPPRALLSALWVGVFAAWLAVAGDWVERVAIVVWAGVLGLGEGALAARVAGRDRALLYLAAVIPVNLLTAVVPLALPWHGGTRLGDGLAYGFCEVPDRPTVWATLPVCDSVKAGYEDCRDGAVVEYDRATKRRIAAYHYLSPAFHGRLELIECLDDEIHVAVQAAVIRGEPVLQSALAFPVADPTVFTPHVVGPGVGITIAHDRGHQAVFYSSEYSHRVVRLDRRSEQLHDVASDDLARRWIHPMTLKTYSGSSLFYSHSIHPGRNRLYLGEWMQGRQAVAIDLTTLGVVARYDAGGGGALGITVDRGRDRLIVSSVWGIEVFDLATDALVTRRRFGFGNRPAIVDETRNRLYVGSTVEGKIRILDRDTYAVIGQIPIGIGTRFPYLSADRATFYASSVAAHFYWDADALGPASSRRAVGAASAPQSVPAASSKPTDSSASSAGTASSAASAAVASTRSPAASTPETAPATSAAAGDAAAPRRAAQAAISRPYTIPASTPGSAPT